MMESKSPAMLLHEKFGAEIPKKYQLVPGRNGELFYWQCSATIRGQIFRGYAPKQKEAMQEMAKKAMEFFQNDEYQELEIAEEQDFTTETGKTPLMMLNEMCQKRNCQYKMTTRTSNHSVSNTFFFQSIITLSDRPNRPYISAPLKRKRDAEQAAAKMAWDDLTRAGPPSILKKQAVDIVPALESHTKISGMPKRYTDHDFMFISQERRALKRLARRPTSQYDFPMQKAGRNKPYIPQKRQVRFVMDKNKHLVQMPPTVRHPPVIIHRSGPIMDEEED